MGLVWVVDKLIEHLNFTNSISLIRHASFIAGAKSDHDVSVPAAGPDYIDPGDDVPPASVNEALLSFSSMDHASLLGLGGLDIQRLCELCAFVGFEGTLDGMSSGAVGDDDEIEGGRGGAGNVIEGTVGDGKGVGVGDGSVVEPVGESVVGVTEKGAHAPCATSSRA